MGHGLISKIILAVCIAIATPFVEANHPSREVREAVAPYLIPQEHPIKPALDALFSSARVTMNLDSLSESGFSKTTPRKFTKLIVTKHPSFPGYIFKLYLDVQRYYKEMPEHHFWILRVQGVRKVQQEIKSLGLENIFKAPKKWIYPLPTHPRPPEGYYTKYYILVEEDMNILSNRDNNEIWASDRITHELLDNLYTILKEVGLSDGAKPDNIPFSVDGRIAFIDTQSFGKQKVRYKKLTPYLSKSNQAYWEALTNK